MVLGEIRSEAGYFSTDVKWRDFRIDLLTLGIRLRVNRACVFLTDIKCVDGILDGPHTLDSVGKAAESNCEAVTNVANMFTKKSDVPNVGNLDVDRMRGKIRL